MRNSANVSRAVAIVIAVAGLTALPVAAATPLASLNAAGATLHWDIQSAAPELQLSVAGPDVSIRETSRGGSALSLSLNRANGPSLPDGTYKWEIRESFAGVNDNVYDPFNGRDQVDAASADSKIEVDGRVERGVFTIKNGLVVDSTLVEQTAAADKEAQ